MVSVNEYFLAIENNSYKIKSEVIRESLSEFVGIIILLVSFFTFFSSYLGTQTSHWDKVEYSSFMITLLLLCT